MKDFRFHHGKAGRGGFNLVETSITIGVMSFGFLALAPLLGVGMKASRFARTDRESAQIARNCIEEAKQGTLGTGTAYLDDQGATCSPLNAAFTVQPTTQALGATASQLTLRVTPLGAPERVQVYAVVLPTTAQN